MKPGDLVKSKRRNAIGIIVSEKKIYGELYKVVFWSDNNIDIEDESTIEVLEKISKT